MELKIAHLPVTRPGLTCGLHISLMRKGYASGTKERTPILLFRTFMPTPSPRYGIAEWYGKDLTTLSPDQRQLFGKIALGQAEGTVTPQCPFLSTLIPNSKCNKSGGVCSIRKFSSGADGAGAVVPDTRPVAVCPSRFLQDIEDDKSLFVWISEKMLGIDHPTVVKETPFLRTVSDVERPPETAPGMQAEADEEKKAGRIDWIVLNPATLDAPELDWCAVETQALYFSGRSMDHEFEAYAAAPQTVLYPIKFRRPDYRSSGPKRLAPQLDVKVPVLRNWGKKVVVVIDSFFFENMNRLIDAYPRAVDDSERRDNAEIVWFVVKFDEQLRLRADKVIYTTLDSSRRALNATEPLSKAAFTAVLKGVVIDPDRTNKVFRV